MSNRIPAGLLRSAIGLVARKGWDAEALLGTAGISPGQLRDPLPRFTDAQVLRVIDACCRHTDDDLLGLGRQPVPRGTMRMICYAMASVPDVGRAVDRFIRIGRAIPGLPPVTLTVRGEEAELAIDTSTLDDADGLLAVSTAVIVLHTVEWVINGAVPLHRVELPFPEPRDPGTLGSLVSMPTTFDGDRLAIVMHRKVLAAPIHRDERSLLDYLRKAPSLVLSGSRVEEPVSHRVQQLVKKELQGHRRLAAEHISSRLSMSVPTLRRRLRDEGTSFREVRDEVLRAAAIASLAGSSEPIAALSERLGFSEPSAFTRAFRRWTGHSPHSYRAAHRGHEPPPAVEPRG